MIVKLELIFYHTNPAVLNASMLSVFWNCLAMISEENKEGDVEGIEGRKMKGEK